MTEKLGVIIPLFPRGVRTKNHLVAAVLSHGFCGEVGVATGAVPVTGDRLRVQGDHGAELLGDAVQQVSRDPDVVTGFYTFIHSTHSRVS